MKNQDVVMLCGIVSILVGAFIIFGTIGFGIALISVGVMAMLLAPLYFFLV